MSGIWRPVEGTNVISPRQRTASMLSVTFNPAVAKDMYGFVLETRDAPKYSEFIENHLQDTRKQQERLEAFRKDGGMDLFDLDLLHPYDECAAKADNMLSDPDKKKLLQLGTILRGGIPPNLRADLWTRLAGVHKKPVRTGIFQTLIASSSQRMSIVTEQIEKDLARTFPGFTFTPTGYEFQPALRRVLRAYSIRNPSVGYCQSMNFVAGGLLVFLEEEEAFWVLCWFVEHVMNGYFTKTMIGLQVDSKIFEKLLKENLPALAKHLEKIGLHYILFTAQWFLCLFLNNISSEGSFRIWDALFYYGTKILYEVSVNIFRIYQKELMLIKEQTEIVGFLNRRLMEMLDVTELLNTSIKVFDNVTLARKKEKYFLKIREEVVARHYTLQLIELTRLTQFTKIELENMMKQFKDLNLKSDHLGITYDSFVRIICKVFQWEYDDYFMKRLFHVFDTDQDSLIDFKELIFGISVLCRGSIHLKMKTIFKIIDYNEDMLVDKEEMTKILQSIYTIDSKKTNPQTYSLRENRRNRQTFSIMSTSIDPPKQNQVVNNGANNNGNNNNNNNNANNNGNSFSTTDNKTGTMNVSMFQRFFQNNNNAANNSNNNNNNNNNTSPRPMFRRAGSENLLGYAKRLEQQQQQQQQQQQAQQASKPRIDFSTEVKFYVDMLFKAAEEYTKTASPNQLRSSVKIPHNTNTSFMNFIQFNEVIQLQPIIVDCFHLATASPRFGLPIDLRL